MKKDNLFIRILKVISPTWALNRLKKESQIRAYESALDYPSSDWNRTGLASSANSEIERAQKSLTFKSRDLARNSPHAAKAIDVIMTETVGYGIMPTIKGSNKRAVKEIQALWKEVAETSLCDYEGRDNFYTLQGLVMRSMVESGEVLSIRHLTTEAPKVQIVEGDLLCNDQLGVMDKDSKNRIIQGIEIDENGKRVAYHLYKNHPGDRQFISNETRRIEASRIDHIFKKQRPGQLRGVPWAHAVIEDLKDLADYQHAELIRQKVSACLVGAVTTNGQDNVLKPEDVLAKREKETLMTPASWRYLNPGEDVKFSTPPSSSGYSPFVREVLRAVACGYGITYERMTNDYSQVNFSSGRMGDITMRRNIDSWRWSLLIPHFCEPYFKSFLLFAKAKGYKTEGIYAEWVPPAFSMIDPTKEIAAEKEAVKAGFKSKSMVIREQGLDPDRVTEEIEKERKEDASKGLNFDIYESQNENSNNSQNDNNDNKEEDNSEELESENRFYIDDKDQLWKLTKAGFERV